jgi:hypothetical protein
MTRLLTYNRIQLFRNFDIALINPTHPWDVLNSLGLFTISNMWVQVMERSPRSS